MKKTIFAKKRESINYSKDLMAKELNIPVEKYEQIENGRIPMPRDLIDDFFAIISKRKEEPSVNKLHLVAEKNRIQQEFYELLKNDRTLLKQKLVDFGIPSQKELCDKLGINYSSYASINLNNYRQKCFSIQERVVNFFDNELNREPLDILTERKISVIAKERLDEKEIEEFKNFLSQNNLCKADFYNETGYPQANLYNLLAGEEKTIRVIENYREAFKKFKKIHNKTEQTELNTTAQYVPIAKPVAEETQIQEPIANEREELVNIYNPEAFKTFILPINQEQEIVTLPTKNKKEELTEQMAKIQSELAELEENERREKVIEQMTKDVSLEVKKLAVVKDLFLENGFTLDFVQEYILNSIK